MVLLSDNNCEIQNLYNCQLKLGGLVLVDADMADVGDLTLLE